MKRKINTFPFLLTALAIAVVGGSVVWKEDAQKLLSSFKPEQQIVEELKKPDPTLAPPSINWVNQPQVVQQGRVSMAFKVGASAPIHSVKVDITPVVKLTGVDIPKDEIEVPSFSVGKKSLDWEGQIDLTGSLLAGTPVVLQVVAEDGDKRLGSSDTVSITLPERSFNNPLAKTVYILRKALRDNPQQNRLETLRNLAGILQQRDKFENQELTLLTLRSAAVRIALDRTDDGLRTALDLLWHAALLFEENPVHVAVRG